MQSIKYLSCLLILFNLQPLYSQNWLPLEVGNKWQYIIIDYAGGNGNDTTEYNATLFVNYVVKDTLISSKKYYQLSLYPLDWYTYNQIDKILLVRWNDADSLVMDFSSQVGSFIYSFLPDSRSFFYSEIDSGVISAFDSIKTFKGNNYFVVGPDAGGGFKYVESYGLVEYNYYQYFGLPPFSYREQYRIIQANINGVNYSENVYPVIIVSPVTTISDSIFHLILEIEHQYTIIITSSFPHSNLNFIDSLYMHSFYSREDSVVTNSIVICESIPNTEQWSLSTPLNLSLLRNNFKFNYKFEAVDKGIIPHRSFAPDSGYFIAIYDSTSGIVPIENKLFSFFLSQNYPNPFNPSTRIKYQIPELSFVTLKIYDVLGKEVATLDNEEKPAGSYEFEFSIGQESIPVLPSGTYFYQLKAGNFIETKKMVFIK